MAGPTKNPRKPILIFCYSHYITTQIFSDEILLFHLIVKLQLNYSSTNAITVPKKINKYKLKISIFFSGIFRSNIGGEQNYNFYKNLLRNIPCFIYAF